MSSPHRGVRFMLVGALGVVVQLAVVSVLVRWCRTPVEAAAALAVVSAILHNFLWHQQWTWADRALGRPWRALFHFAAANGAVSLVGSVAAATLLGRMLHLPAVVSSTAAIAATGLLNYWLADRIVFRRAALGPAPTGPGAAPPSDPSRGSSSRS